MPLTAMVEHLLCIKALLPWPLPSMSLLPSVRLHKEGLTHDIYHHQFQGIRPWFITQGKEGSRSTPWVYPNLI